MSMTALLGLSFGVFPCLLFGFIMLLSLLLCEYIEEYVAKHLCAWKNRRRRGLRSFYRDFRDRRNSHGSRESAHNFPVSPPQPQHSRRTYQPPGERAIAWHGGGDSSRDMRLMPIENYPYPSPTAPPPPAHGAYPCYGAQITSYPTDYSLLSANDPPPSYEECVLPRARLNGNSSASRSQNASESKTKSKPSRKSSSTEKDKD